MMPFGLCDWSNTIHPTKHFLGTSLRYVPGLLHYASTYYCFKNIFFSFLMRVSPEGHFMVWLFVDLFVNF